MIYEIQQSPKMVKTSRITSSFQWYLMEIFVELCQSQVWHQARPPAKWYTDTFRKQLISQQSANLERVLEFYNRAPWRKSGHFLGPLVVDSSSNGIILRQKRRQEKKSEANPQSFENPLGLSGLSFVRPSSFYFPVRKRWNKNGILTNDLRF